MSDPVRIVRPSPDTLRALPTLATESPADGVVWELKKVTDLVNYWLCTRGYEPGNDAGCAAFVAGRAIAECRTKNPETGEFDMIDYGPENVRELQAIDFVWRLTEEIERLEREQEAEHTWDRQKAIDEARRDREQAMKALQLKTGPGDYPAAEDG